MFSQLLKDKFLKNSFFYISGTMLAGFLGYVFHFFISRKLSVAQYGELQSLISLFSILGVFGSAITYFTIKYSSVIAKAKDYEANSQFIKWLMSRVDSLAIILFLVFMAFSPLFYSYLHLSSFWGLFVVALALIFTILIVGYNGILTGWEEFILLSLISIFVALTKLFFGFLAVLFFPIAPVAMLAFLISGIAGWALARFLTRKQFDGYDIKKNVDWRKKYFSNINIKKTIMPILAFSFVIMLVQNIDILLVKNLTSPETTGYYGALALLGKVILWVNLGIVMVVLPSACANGHKGGSISRKMLLSAYGLILFTSLSAILLYFLFPKLIISMLFGAKYAVFTKDLWLFGISALVLSVLILESNFAYARHDFNISYILAGVVVLMTVGVYVFHNNIREVVLAVIVSIVAGYLATLTLNLLHRKKQAIESIKTVSGVFFSN